MTRRGIVVAVDAAAPVVGVALRAGDATWTRTERLERGAEKQLVPWIEELLREAGGTARDLTGVAVTAGPGSFTGVRVALATAVGLAQARGVPVWTTSTLHTRAARVGEARVLALLDARKSRYYASSFVNDASVFGPADVTLEVALASIRAPFVATGEGALLAADRVVAAGGVVHAAAGDPAVDVLARLGAESLALGEGKRPTEVVPLYLRDADALVRGRG